MWVGDRLQPSASGPPPASEGPRPAAIVIGAGLGGLAAAIRLGARGYAVSIVDRLAEPGGRAAIFRQDGFVFDRGPTIITAPFMLEALWALAGRRLAQDVTLKPLDPFYQIRFADGSALDWSGDEAAMRARIDHLAPGESAGYDAFMRAAAAIYAIGFEKLSAKPFASLLDMAKALPAMARLRADRSLHALAAKYVRDPRLRMALSFHPLFIGGNPFDVTAIYGLIAHLERAHGVHYALGGTGALVAGLAGLVRHLGGRFFFNRTVTRILVEAGTAKGVVLENGEVLRAPIVISNACASHTYGRLLADAPRRRWSDRRLGRMRASMGVFLWYFGTKKRYEHVGHHTILMGPRYRALLDDIFRKKRLSADFSLYLHRPSASDPNVAPAGHDAFYALVPVPNLLGGQDWAHEAEPMRQRVAQLLGSSLLPGLSDEIVTSRLVTPADFATEFLSEHGAAFGFEPIFTQSAWFRPHNVSEDIRNLFLVGAGTHPGAGIPGVLSSALILDEVVPHASHFR